MHGEGVISRMCPAFNIEALSGRREVGRASALESAGVGKESQLVFLISLISLNMLLNISEL